MGVEYATRVLEAAGLPADREGMARLVRVHADGHSWSEDVAPDLGNVAIGETLMPAGGLASAIFGKDSEQAYAAVFLRQFHTLQARLDARDYDDALYLAARLGLFAAEADFVEELRTAARSREGLGLGNEAKKKRAAARAAALRARADELRRKYPDAARARIYRLLAEREKRDPVIPGQPTSWRQIRRILTGQ